MYALIYGTLSNWETWSQYKHILPATSIDHIHDLLRERGVAVPRWQLMAHLNHRLRKSIPETIQGFVVERVNSTISSRRQVSGATEEV